MQKVSKIIQTQNFYLRPFATDDFEIFCAWVETSNAVDPKYFTNPKPVLDRFIRVYHDLGFTKFAVFFEETDEFVGYCGFELLHDPDGTRNALQEIAFTKKMKQFAGEKYKDNHGDLELGYRLHQKFWNKGYATELAKAICDFAFNKFPELTRIVAVTDPDNIASQRVLEKVGFKYLQNVETKEYGIERFYVLERL